MHCHVNWNPSFFLHLVTLTRLCLHQPFLLCLMTMMMTVHDEVMPVPLSAHDAMNMQAINDSCLFIDIKITATLFYNTGLLWLNAHPLASKSWNDQFLIPIPIHASLCQSMSSCLHFLQNVLSPFGTHWCIIDSFSLLNTLKTYISLYFLPMTGFSPSVEEGKSPSRVCQASMWAPWFVVLYHWTAFWPQHLVPLSLLHPTFCKPDIHINDTNTQLVEVWSAQKHRSIIDCINQPAAEFELSCTH